MSVRQICRAALGAALCVYSLLALAGAYDDVIGAIKSDDATAAAQLIRRGVEVETVDAQGNTLLMLAAREGSLRAVKMLCEMHARLDAANSLGETALMYAALQGHLEVVRTLLAQGAAVDGNGWTPLIYAAVKGTLDVARLLLASGAKVNAAGPSVPT